MIIGFDVETHLIKPGMLAPKLVCTSLAWTESSGATDTSLLPADQSVDSFRAFLESGDTLVAHNAPFDVAVMVAEDPTLLPLVFQAYDEGRIKCTEVRERLKNNATGQLTYDAQGKKQSYSLASLVSKYFGEHLEKEDTYRLRYHELDGVPLKQWPEEARSYAIRDAVEALRVYQAQGGPFLDEDRQQRAAFWLHLCAMWGMRTDPSRVEDLKNRLASEVEALWPTVVKGGYIRTDGTKDTKKIQARILELMPEVSRTPTGKPETGEDVLLAVPDEALNALGKIGTAKKLLSTYVPKLELGTKFPLCPRYISVLETGRTSCVGGDYATNIQNQPTFAGVRECYTPRPGFVFVDVDYDTLELRALAQSCLERFGFSKMAEQIRAGRDLHTAFAASLLGVSYEDAVVAVKTSDNGKYMRKLAKAFNFGISGGLGQKTFCEFAKNTYGVVLGKGQFLAYKDQYFRTFPEIKMHLEWAGQITESGPAVVGPPHLRLVRGGLSYSKLANILFQERAAAGAKDAGWLVTKACHTPTSALYGSRVVAFVHDEYVVEAPKGRAERAAGELVKLMVQGMSNVIRDVPITASPIISETWSKS